MALIVDIDAKEVLAKLGKLSGAELERAARAARGEVGDALLNLSQKEVPHDIGTLANTGVSQAEGNDHVVGYNTPYAARLHEHPEYKFQKGRKGKYLEQPIKENINQFTQVFGMAVKERLGL